MDVLPKLTLYRPGPFERPRQGTPGLPDPVIYSLLQSLPEISRAQGGGRLHTETLQERLRNLPPMEQRKLARSGGYNERTTLERLYGKTVWESLLRNPKLTMPEAARIARMGALPRPLIELILENRAWLTSPQVRRALLANRRLTKAQVAIVLRATPKPELKLMGKQMGYPALVRTLAAEMTRGG